MKVCRECKQLKTLDFFGNRRRNKDRKRGICKLCNNLKYLQYRERNKSKELARHTTWRVNNRASEAARGRASYRKNPEVYKANANIRRGRMKNQVCTCCTREERVEYYKTCPPGWEIDHIQAIAKGGLDCLKNYQQLPKGLNRKKGTKNIIYL